MSLHKLKSFFRVAIVIPFVSGKTFVLIDMMQVNKVNSEATVVDGAQEIGSTEEFPESEESDVFFFVEIPGFHFVPYRS